MLWTSRNFCLVLLGWSLLFVCNIAKSEESSAAQESSDYPFPALLRSKTLEAAPVEEISSYQSILLEVEINDQKLNQTALVLQDKNGIFYFWIGDLTRWRFQTPPPDTAVVFEGQTYYPAYAIAQSPPLIDQSKLTLMIEAKPQAFLPTTRISRYANLPPPVRSGPGGFVNYDLFTSNTVGYSQHSGQFELGYFNNYGVGINTFLVRNTDTGTTDTRLDTTWTIDFPEKMQSIRLGDEISSPGTWGRAVRFGGIQYGTNFTTQPGFITYPMRGAKGEAILPSTVDVFINNALVSRQTVPPGPFAINNLPIVTGSGEVNLVIRDLLGREQLITEPFYASQVLLKKDLEVFSYEMGLVRNNYASESNNYSAWIFSENYRKGLSDLFTGELHTEFMADHLTSGIGGDYLLQDIGTLSSYLAASYGKTGSNYISPSSSPFNPNLPSTNISDSLSNTSGSLILFGFDRLSRPWSVGVRSQWASTGFTEVGQQSNQFSPSNLLTTNLSYTTQALGSLNLGYMSQVNRDMASSRIATIGWGISLSRYGFLSISALRDLASDNGTTIFSIYSIPLGNSTNASATTQTRRGSGTANTNDLAAVLQKSVPLGEGFGYLLQARNDGSSLATYTQQTNLGTYSVAVTSDQLQTSTSLDANGGIAILGKDLFMSRRLDQSFAVAKIPDYPGINVLVDNQIAAKTDSRGEALIPRLRAYDRNEITVNPFDFPLDAKILSVKIEAVPYYRSGLQVKFPIERSNAATFTVQLEDGSFLPEGAEVQVDNLVEHYKVGADGAVYVSNLSRLTKLHAYWFNQNCAFELRFMKSSDPLPDLGVVICKGIVIEKSILH